jgi:hypothetical protein
MSWSVTGKATASTLVIRARGLFVHVDLLITDVI